MLLPQWHVGSGGTNAESVCAFSLVQLYHNWLTEACFSYHFLQYTEASELDPTDMVFHMNIGGELSRFGYFVAVTHTHTHTHAHTHTCTHAATQDANSARV